MKFQIIKPNGTLLEKEVDPKDVGLIEKLQDIGWVESKPKAKKKSKKAKGDK
tara:strand:+ start:348 stop:503 length:156 start_codon:yes stop_codon:yes gene_type:complete